MSAETATAEQLRDLTPDQVERAIALAEAYAAHLTRSLGANPDGDAIARDLQAGGSAEGRALVGFIDGLTRPAREELVALVWCGMGEYGFTEARAYAQATADAGIAQYLAKKALVLAGYLRTAMKTLGGYRVGNG